MRFVPKDSANPERWFAWYPVKLHACDDGAWVWLEHVNRYYIEGAGYGMYLYYQKRSPI